MIDPYLKCLKKYKDKKKKEEEGEISSQTIIDNAIYFFNSDENRSKYLGLTFNSLWLNFDNEKKKLYIKKSNDYVNRHFKI